MRLLRRLFLFLAGLYVLGTLLGGIGLAWIAFHPPRARIRAFEESNVRATSRQVDTDFRDVELKAADGVVLSAWFMRPRNWNEDVVILLHGVSDNRMGMYGYGKWLLQNHYAVLLPDARAHGASEGVASYGLKESDDIRRWVDWLEANDHPHCVYGLGESMGAAQLLQSLPKEPRFCAVVAESPFATFREVAYARVGRAFGTGPWLGRTFFRPAVDVGFLYARLKYGVNMENASPADAVAHVQPPVLLIHGENDTNIPPYHSDLIQARNRASVQVWKVPGAVHTGAHHAAPKEFEERVLEWFASHRPPDTRTAQ